MTQLSVYMVTYHMTHLIGTMHVKQRYVVNSYMLFETFSLFPAIFVYRLLSSRPSIRYIRQCAYLLISLPSSIPVSCRVFLLLYIHKRYSDIVKHSMIYVGNADPFSLPMLYFTSYQFPIRLCSYICKCYRRPLLSSRPV